MLYKIILLILITFTPFLELRFSIPIGILQGEVGLPFGMTLQGFGMNWMIVFLVCVTTNAILGPLVYFFLDKIIHLFTRIKIIDRLYTRIVEKTQKKTQKYVERWGWIGLAIFIGMPVPGSGSYSGAIAAYFLGLGYKKFIITNIIGVLIAGILVTTGTLIGSGIWNSIV